MTPAQAAAVFAVIIALGLIGFLAYVSYNAVVKLAQLADRGWANIDVALKQRHDELPNLVSAVRGVMAFERDVLEDVTRLRAAYQPEAPVPQQAATSEATTAAVQRLLAVVERYPELRSAANVMALQQEIARLEDVIATRRELYNDAIFRYNTTIAQMPAGLIAPLFGWRPRAFFSVAPSEAAPPSLDLRDSA
ncbi:MAG: LemA family protein [Chloroflexi bacterium]|nr:MAG: LemA family protein [Chloroflexota bacterium]